MTRVGSVESRYSGRTVRELGLSVQSTGSASHMYFRLSLPPAILRPSPSTPALRPLILFRHSPLLSQNPVSLSDDSIWCCRIACDIQARLDISAACEAASSQPLPVISPLAQPAAVSASTLPTP